MNAKRSGWGSESLGAGISHPGLSCSGVPSLCATSTTLPRTKGLNLGRVGATASTANLKKHSCLTAVMLIGSKGRRAACLLRKRLVQTRRATLAA